MHTRRLGLAFAYDLIIIPLLIVVANVSVYLLVGTWGRRTTGTGQKYEPFTGGEEAIPKRGLYRSELFVFAVLFMVAEVFALILAGSFMAPANYYPLLYLGGGSGVMLLVVLWFMHVGGGRF
jgi:NADH:ubiquinone oxidoreductase subunit 3 (subunit A)